jgi:hypothetical protein
MKDSKLKKFEKSSIKDLSSIKGGKREATVKNDCADTSWFHIRIFKFDFEVVTGGC